MKKTTLRLISFFLLLFLCWESNAQNTPFPANKTYSYGLMATNRNSADAQAAYNTWKQNFVAACGSNFRVKFDDQSQTVSEGIAYGMLLSAYAGDKTLFDGLWNYYKQFRNSHGVMHWKISGCNSVVGQNAAADAEFDAAMALIVANHQWGSSGSINYSNDAKALITAIKNFEIESGSYVVKPGDYFGGSNLTNASYFSPAYFRAFGAFMNDASFWNNVASKSYEVINANLTKNSAAGGLVSDWQRADGSHSSSASGYFSGGTRYHYDAARTPWRIAVDYIWYGSADAKAYSQKSSDFVRVRLGGSQNVKDGYYQNGSAYGQWHNSAFTGAFATAAMGGGDQTHLNNSYSDLRGINDAGSYFNQTLKTLYLFTLTGNFYLPGSTPPPVNIAPTVSLTAPANNASYTAPASITLSANASDADGTVSRVEFFSGATKLGEDLSSPYGFSWTSVAAGTYTVTAKATDNAGAVTTSSPITINVTTANNNTPPTVSLTAPANNASYVAPANITLSANAADANGTVTRVEFFSGATKLGEDLTSPYGFSWTSVAAGTYTVTAKATDNAGAVTTSSPITINVTTANNNTPPTVSLTAPANNASYVAPANITLSANAADANGTVSRVEFFSGATKLGEDLTSPYGYAWNAVGVGTYSVTARATDNAGAVTISAPITINVTSAPVSQSPYGGTAANIPGRIEAERYDLGGSTVAYSDADASNNGNAFRTDAVDIQATTDAGAGYNVGWTAAGEWLEYTVNVNTAGKYDFKVRVAATAAGKSMHIELNGVNVTGAIAVPNTGGWQTYQTVSVSGVSLTSGSKIMRVVMDTDGINLNYVDVLTSSAPSDPETPTNQAPSVSLVGPANNASYVAPAAITLEANAADNDGTVSKVEFYSGNTLLHTELESPYVFSWENVAAGTYTVTAKATDNANAVTTSSAITVVVTNPTTPTPGNCVTTATPSFSEWTVRNDWADQSNGSATSNESDALKVTHRQWGKSELWVVQTVKAVSIVAGQQYTISVDYKDNASVPVSSLQAGFASELQWNGATLAQPLGTLSGATSSSAFTTKSVTLTATTTGTVYLVIKENWASQPNQIVTNYIKNVSVCPVSNSLQSNQVSSIAAAEAYTASPNPFESESAILIHHDKNVPMVIKVINSKGWVVFESAGFTTNQPVNVGGHLAVGIYVVHAVFEGKVVSFTLMKN